MTDRVHLKRKVTLREKQPTDDKTTSSSKVPKIVCGIIVVALLGVGGYFLLNKTKVSHSEAQPAAQTVVSQADSTSTDTDSTTITTQNDGKENPSSEDESISQNGVVSAEENQSAATAPTTKSEQSVVANPAAPIEGTVEEKARQVIRGNYGNGQIRKDKLGAEYRTIQDKVNEMYRKGLIY